MPETPYFDQIADKMVHAGECTSDDIAARLRQVWNARGLADVVMLTETYPERTANVASVLLAIRRLDR